MSDLRDLYQEVILDHNRRPRNAGTLEQPTHVADGNNPLCGDKLTVHVRVEGHRIADIRFDGRGCAISKASASLMTEAVKGQTIDDVEALYAEFHTMVTAPTGAPDDERLGKLTVLSGVAEFPMRIKCATLPWHTLRAALQSPGTTASTENETTSP